MKGLIADGVNSRLWVRTVLALPEGGCSLVLVDVRFP